MQYLRLLAEQRRRRRRTGRRRLHRLLGGRRGVGGRGGVVDLVDDGGRRGLFVEVHEGPQLAVGGHHLRGIALGARVGTLQENRGL